MKKIIFNHKSFLEYDEIKKYKVEIEKIKQDKYELILMPQMIFLTEFKDSKIKIGAQNFYSYNEGAYTGETNIKSLKSLNVKYLLLGHSERKSLVNEKYDLTRNKLFKSLNAKMPTILCIGEHSPKENSIKFLKKELKFYMENLEEINLNHLIIAYEPSYLIGGFESLDTSLIQKRVEVIKTFFRKKYKKEIEVLYGGSISKDNIKEVMEVTDGVLIGKLSSDISKVKELIKILN